MASPASWEEGCQGCGYGNSPSGPIKGAAIGSMVTDSLPWAPRLLSADHREGEGVPESSLCSPKSNLSSRARHQPGPEHLRILMWSETLPIQSSPPLACTGVSPALLSEGSHHSCPHPVYPSPEAPPVTLLYIQPHVGTTFLEGPPDSPSFPPSALEEGTPQLVKTQVCSGCPGRWRAAALLSWCILRLACVLMPIWPAL